MSRAVPLPGITFVGSSYPRDEAVFKPLPKNDVRYIRRREVQRFRRVPRSPERPRWNLSVLDEAHPFPERPIMHSLQRYEGVEVVKGTFPSMIRGTTHLRTGCRSPHWTLNASRARGRHSSYASSCTPVPKQSFVSKVIIEENSEEKKALQRGWCASTFTWNPMGTMGNLEESKRSYVDLNKTKTDLLKDGAYISPFHRVSCMNERMRDEKRNARAREEWASQSLSKQHSGPAVFKMSNIDEWWHLDPTLAITKQAAQEGADGSTADVNENAQS